MLLQPKLELGCQTNHCCPTFIGAVTNYHMSTVSQPIVHCLQVVIKEKVLELLLYFTKHEEEEVKTKAIIGLGKNTIFSY